MASACLFGDLIDLAMVSPLQELMHQAMANATFAYGDSVTTDLVKAIEDLSARPNRLDR